MKNVHNKCFRVSRLVTFLLSFLFSFHLSLLFFFFFFFFSSFFSLPSFSSSSFSSSSFCSFSSTSNPEMCYSKSFVHLFFSYENDTRGRQGVVFAVAWWTILQSMMVNSVAISLTLSRGLTLRKSLVCLTCFTPLKNVYNKCFRVSRLVTFLLSFLFSFHLSLLSLLLFLLPLLLLLLPFFFIFFIFFLIFLFFLLVIKP